MLRLNLLGKPQRKIHSVLNKKIIIKLISVTSLLLFALCSFIYLFYQESKPSYATAKKLVRFNYLISNTSGKFIPITDFSIKTPMSIAGIQNIESISSSKKNEFSNTVTGEQSIHFSIHNLPPYASKVVDLTLAVQTTDKPKYDRINNSDFLKSEKYIELDSVAVKTLAVQLKGYSPEETAKNIYEWLVNNVTSLAYTADSKGAQYVIEKKSGDCTEFTYAFVALARANGLPARGVRGLWVPAESTIVNAADYHDWAEFYDGKQWVLVDAQKYVFNSDYTNYLPIAYLTGSNKNLERFRISHNSIRVSFQ